MRTITLQEDEAIELEGVLSEMLASGSITDAAKRRKIRRVSMKLHWAKHKDAS